MEKKTKPTDCYQLADAITQIIAKNSATLNEGLTACCYAIASIMVTAEECDPRNNSDGVIQQCAEAIDKTYKMLKETRKDKQ